jgi:DNA-binding Xre family transcriptional regulator
MTTIFLLAEVLGSISPPPSLSELERATGLDRKTIRAIRDNTATRVDLATLDALATALKCEPAALIGRQNPGRQAKRK